MEEHKRLKLDMYPNLPQGILQFMIGCVATSTNSTTHAKTVFKMYCPAKFTIKNVIPVCCIKQLITTRCRWIVVYEFSGDALTASDTDAFTGLVPQGLFVMEYSSDKQKTLTVTYGVHCCVC